MQINYIHYNLVYKIGLSKLDWMDSIGWRELFADERSPVVLNPFIVTIATPENGFEHAIR